MRELVAAGLGAAAGGGPSPAPPGRPEGGGSRWERGGWDGLQIAPRVPYSRASVATQTGIPAGAGSRPGPQRSRPAPRTRGGDGQPPSAPLPLAARAGSAPWRSGGRSSPAVPCPGSVPGEGGRGGVPPADTRECRLRERPHRGAPLHRCHTLCPPLAVLSCLSQWGRAASSSSWRSS